MDIMAVNGLIHSLDRALFPPPLFEKAPTLSVSSNPDAVTGELSKGERDENAMPFIQDTAAVVEPVSSTG